MGVVEFGVLGLGGSAILALLALGVVVIFRGAGVLNLAQGAYAMLAGYICWDLEQRGLPQALAIVVSVAFVAFLGFATDQLVLRRLRTASPLARLIATGGILLLIQSAVAILWGVIPKSVSPILPSQPIHFNGVALPSDRLWLLLLATILTGAVGLTWRYTKFGWIAEAVSESPRLAAAHGWSTEAVSGATWALGTGLAAVAGIFVAPITELDTTAVPALIVPALAAALVGQFRNFSLVFGGAVLIGVLQSEIGEYVHVTGAVDVVPFVIIILVMVLRGTSLPLRGHIVDRLPRVGNGVIPWRVALPAFVLAVVAMNLIHSLDWLGALAGTFAVATILLSFVVVIGYTGQVSFAQLSLAGAGALIAAKLASGSSFPFLLALLCAAVGSAVVGAVIALPALRTRGVNLTIITLGMAVAAQSMIFNSSLAGSIYGITLPAITVFGLRVDPVGHPEAYVTVTLVAFIAMVLVVVRLRRTPAGRTLLAVRGNERAAAASGINIMLGKLLGFALGGAIAGVGGTLLAFSTPVATFAAFDPITGLSYLAQAAVGGLGFVFGALFGSTLSPSSVGSVIALHWQKVDLYLPLISSVALLVTLATCPDGVIYHLGRLIRALTPQWLRGQDAAATVRSTADDRLRAADSLEPLKLEVDGLSVRYGAVTAVDNVSLSVQPGQIVGLIGANGAGKTSLIDAITGFAAISSGSVSVNGRDLTREPAYRRARLGVARSFQSLELYSDMTVAEHVLTAADGHRVMSLVKSFFVNNRGIPPSVAQTLEDFELWEHRDRLPDELPYGRRRLLGVARAMAGGGRVLLIDEPVAGLDEAESEEFARVIRRLARERRVAVLVVEHDMPFVMSVCDEIVIIDFGKRIAVGAPEEIRQNPLAIAAYLGDENVSVDTEGDSFPGSLVVADGADSTVR